METNQVMIPMGPVRLEGDLTVPGAIHLFEEAGALERVARLASDWFHNHLRAVGHQWL
jgi:hypothetical protein